MSGTIFTSMGPNFRENISTAKKSLRRDLLGLFFAVAIALLLVFLFDTGSLADWVARHKDTKIDEAIVVGVVLVIGLAVLSIRRWLALSNQLIRYQELYCEMDTINRESVLLGELGDLLQSCLSTYEANGLITDRARILFPESSGAICMIASSRDLVEVAACWGDPALVERFFSPTECWALRRGKIHISRAGSSSALGCPHVAAQRPEWAMCVPMMAHGETLGLLYLDRLENQGHDSMHIKKDGAKHSWQGQGYSESDM